MSREMKPFDITEAPEPTIVMPVKCAPKDTGKRANASADYKAFRSAAGSWHDVDIDIVLATLYESRTARLHTPAPPAIT